MQLIINRKLSARLHKCSVSCRKIMEQEKRYVAVVEFFVWAKTDEEAIEQVKEQCKEQDDKNDDRCELIKLVEQPFATLGNRPVYGS